MTDPNLASHAASFLFISLFILTCCFYTVSSDGSGRHSRFEYKLSFKGPHLTNKQGNVPFWTHYGSAIPSDEQVRITPSLKDQRGGLWSKTKSTNEFWEIEIFFKVSGRGRIGGDGLAVWFTEDLGKPGPVFGSSDNWKGMGLFFDSYDNDGEQNNPYIMVMLNDGSKQYDHFKDGNNQQLGGCMRDFRNKPHPVRTKVRYFNNILTVFYHGGMSDKEEDYELCMRAENVHLTKEGFFGVTGGTGGLADDHDVLKFITHSLTVPQTKDAEEKKQKEISESERKKYEEQYGKYQKELETQKEEFQKEHPEKKQSDPAFESVYERDLRLVYDGQNAINQLVRALHAKVGELTKEVNNLHTGVNTVQTKIEEKDGASKQEINTMISLQNQVHTAIKDMQARKEDGGQNTKKLEQLEQTINTILENVGHILTKTQDFAVKPPPCPTVSCITMSNLFMVVFLVAVAGGGYHFYQQHQNQASKKFY